jgi:MFS family permease
MFHKLIDPVGFGWTTRIVAFVVLAGLSFSLAVIQMRLAPSKVARSQINLEAAFLEAPYLVLNCGLLFTFVGLYFPFFYLPTYFTSFLQSDADIGVYSIAILNAASVFGRITTGLLADRIGCLNTIVPISIIASILAFAWIAIRNEAGTIVYACLYGFSSGAMVSLPPTIVARLTPNVGIIGTRLGMTFIFTGIGLLVGNPIAGALLDLEHAVFWKAQLLSAIMLVAGSLSFMWVRLLMGRKERGWKI